MSGKLYDERAAHDYALRHADVLARFYLLGQPPSRIARDTGLVESAVRQTVSEAWRADVTRVTVREAREGS